MKKLRVEDFKAMIDSAAANLENSENEVNGLNVFPVPDGDTGTNMAMTFTNGAKEANGCMSSSVGDVAKALSKGLLMGARGNSGVIASQIFRGFAKSVDGKDELNAKEIAEGFVEGARVAYKAIMKPVEGTILTVIREGAWYANHDFENNPDIDIKEYFNNFVNYANESLRKTPDLLPILKEAGVVDSGAAGLCKILEGFKAYFDGNPIVKRDVQILDLVKEEEEFVGYHLDLSLRLNNEYKKNFDKELLIKRLMAVGENIKVEEKDTVLIEVNSLKPGEVLTIAQRYGEFVSIKIENGTSAKQQDKPKKNYGIISVASGEGITNLMKDMGVDIIISGGQTMNPSTKDFLDKIEELSNCETIFIFPNNSNIILAAEQARDLSGKDVIVVPSKSIQAGVSAITLFDAHAKKQVNEKNFLDVISNIKTAQVTYAVKDTVFEGVEVKEGDFISLVGKTIIDSSDDLLAIVKKTIDRLSISEGELITIYTGEGSSDNVTNELVAYISEKGQFEAEVIEGDQPVYSYLFSLE